MPQNTFFSTNSRFSVQPKNDKNTLFFHPPSPSPVIVATATVLAFVLLRNSRFSFHCYIQRETTPAQKLARKRRCDLSRLLARKITKGIHLCKPASLNRPIGREDVTLTHPMTSCSLAAGSLQCTAYMGKKSGLGKWIGRGIRKLEKSWGKKSETEWLLVF